MGRDRVGRKGGKRKTICMLVEILTVGLDRIILSYLGSCGFIEGCAPVLDLVNRGAREER